MEDPKMQIEIKKLEIIRKQNELRLLEQELKILELQVPATSAAAVTSSKKLEETSKTEKLSQIIEQNEDERKTYYFVVTKGPKMGIFTDHSKVKDLPASYYQMINGKKEAEEFFDTAQRNQKQKQVQVQRLNPTQNAILQSRLIKTTVSIDEWKNLYSYVKNATTEEKIIPINRNTWLKGILLEQIQKDKLLDLFNAGLIDIIYPSLNLEELSEIPRVQQAVQTYVQRCKLKEQSRNVYMKIISTIPDWEDEKDYPAYHLIKIGAAGSFQVPKPYNESIEVITSESLESRREDAFYYLYRELESINSESQIKINYVTDNIIILSKYTKKISSADLARVITWKDKVEKNPHVSPSTKENLTSIFKTIEEEIADNVKAGN